MSFPKISKKQRVLNRLEQAKIDYPEYSDMFEDIRLEVSNNYPRFNSKSTWPLTCSICGSIHEVRIYDLYNGVGLDMCQACRSRLTAPIASVIGHVARLSAAHSPEACTKANLTRIQNGTHNFLKSNRKSWETRNSLN